MALATFVPDLAIGIAEKMTAVLENGRVEELSASDVSAAIFACQALRQLFALARQSVEETLRQGVEAKAFVKRFEKTITDLDSILRAVDHAITTAQANLPAELAEQFVTNDQDLYCEINKFRQVLVDAIAKAKVPARPIDWNKVQEVEKAFARGETRPFQRLARQPICN